MLGFVLLGDFFDFLPGISLNFSPPFGRIFVDLFPSILAKQIQVASKTFVSQFITWREDHPI